jgi:hypothetical protein
VQVLMCFPNQQLVFFFSELSELVGKFVQMYFLFFQQTVHLQVYDLLVAVICQKCVPQMMIPFLPLSLLHPV